jgi:hypothetical protein
MDLITRSAGKGVSVRTSRPAPTGAFRANLVDFQSNLARASESPTLLLALAKLSKMSFMRFACTPLISLTLLLQAAIVHALDPASPSEAREIAKEATIYGFPLVENYRAMYSRFAGGFNTIQRQPRIYTADDDVKMPTTDSLTSYAVVDLRTEPVIIRVPPVSDDRYYSLQFVDLNTFNFAYGGTRTQGNSLGMYMLVGPNYKQYKSWRPTGIYQIIHSESDLATVIYRTQLRGVADLQNARNVEQGYSIYPLSTYLGENPPAANTVGFVPPLSEEEQRTSPEFFKQLNFVLQYVAPHPSETEMMARFAKLRIGPGLKFNARDFPVEVEEAIARGQADAWAEYKQIEKQIKAGKTPIADMYGDRDALQGKYFNRMIAAAQNLYGNSKQEELESRFWVDSNGFELNGKTNRYELRIPSDQVLPESGFWSVAVYKLPELRFAANPLNRYQFVSTAVAQLRRNVDGGITVYLQNDSPGSDFDSNWLPVPSGPFLVVQRLYWPKGSGDLQPPKKM